MTNIDDINVRVGREVDAWITRRGVLKRDVATLLGTDPSGISRRLRGIVPFALDELEVLAEAFGIRPSVFLGEPPTVTELRANPTIPAPPGHRVTRNRRGGRTSAYKSPTSCIPRNRTVTTSYLRAEMRTAHESAHIRRAA